MAVELYDAINGDGLFDLLGKAFYAQKLTGTHIGTTIPDEVVDIVTQFRKRTVDMELQTTIPAIVAGHNALKSAGAQLSGSLSGYCSQLIVEMVHDDNKKIPKDLVSCLKELIQQMEDANKSVDASTVAVVVTHAGTNSGDGALVASIKRPDGLFQENAIAESMLAKCTSRGAAASFEVVGDASASLLSVDWPLGSNMSSFLSAQAASSNMLVNSDFEDEDDITNAPDDWQVPVGVIGTDLAMTDVETQRIVLAGTPTGGTYKIVWTNASAVSEETLPIAYDAGSNTVETELRKFQDLSSLTVTTTGTSPNYTHDIAFAGFGGNVSQFTSSSSLTGGSPTITHSTVAAGASQVLVGEKSLKFLPDGSTLTTLQQNIRSRVTAQRSYAVNGFVMRGSSAIGAGVITVDLVNGIGGSVVNDDQGTANSFAFNSTDLTASFQFLSEISSISGETVFRTPTILPEQLYFRFRQSTASTASREIYFDEWAMVEMNELYPGGPYAALFTGGTDFEVDDEITVAVTNNRAGEVQEWYNRNFNMASLGLLLPSDTGGSETIPDTVVS